MSSSKKTNAKSVLVMLCTALIAGIEALPDSSFVLGTQTLTKAQILAPLQAYVASTLQTAADETAWHLSLQGEHVAEAAAKGMVELLKPYLQGRLGKSNPQLQTQFGISPVKKPQASVATKAKAAEKAVATRELLGTKGPKQKKAAIQAAAAGGGAPVAGTSPAVAPSPAASPAAPSAAPGATPSKPTA
jgi:hypothetical protein